MLTEAKKNIISLVLALFLCSLGLIACSKTSDLTEPKNRNNSHQDINARFNQAQNLLDQNKSEEAFHILKNLADQGDAKSQNALGNGYEYGFWGRIDLKKAEYWYRKAANQN